MLFLFSASPSQQAQAKKPEQFSHCNYCGNALDTSKQMPRTCGSCKMTTYRNPLPVALAVIPVEDGVLAIRSKKIFNFS